MGGAKRLRILVVEDEFIIADEIAAMLEDSGHVVVGPVASLEAANAALAGPERPDLAVIDANLRGVSSAPLADRLRELKIPFCVCTGYRADDLKSSFGEIVTLQKPVSQSALAALVAALSSGDK